MKRLALILGILFFGFAPFAAPGTAHSAPKFVPAPLTPEAYRFLSGVKALIDHGQTSEAARRLASHFKKRQKRHSYAYELYGHLLLGLHRNPLAVAVLEQGTAQYPNCPALWQNLAVGYARTNQPARAGQTFWQAYLTGDSRKAPLAFSSAYYFNQAQKTARACGILSDLIAQKGMVPQWVLLLARCRTDSGDLGKAASLLEAAVRIHPQNLGLWKMLGWVYFKDQKLEKAAAAYRIADSLEPGGKDSQLARLFLNLGAVRSGDRLIRAASPEIMDYMASAYARSGDLEKALERAKAALEKAPSDERRFRLARILFRMNRVKKAAEMYEELARPRGKFREPAQWALVVIAWRSGDWAAALDRLRAIKKNTGKQDSPFQRRAARLIPVLETLLS